MHFASMLVMTAVLATGIANATEDDRYIWLEDVSGPRAMAWVHAENDKTTAVLEKDPRYGALYADALAIAQAKDRIPTPNSLNGGIYNFWQDADHVRGLWRRTSLADYKTADPHWQSVLDLDALATQEKANWFYKGADCVEPSEKRCMVNLSDGGEDAVTVREFDLDTGKFVDGGFVLPHGKQTSAWEDDNTLLVAREWQPGDLTASGYPFIVKRVSRREPLSAAKEIFRGTAKDGGYGVSPVSLHDGDGHEVVLINRPLSTFESENYLVTRKGVEQLGLPLKTTVQALVAGALVVSIDQNWDAGDKQIAQGTLVAFDLAELNADPKRLKPIVLYAPGPRESFQSAAATRNALVVTTLDNVRGQAFVYRRGADGSWSHRKLALPDNSAIALVDANLHGDTAFVSVAGFLQPSSLVLVNVNDDSLQTLKTLPPKFDASRDVVEQFEATSTDGTKIPYFVVHPKDMKLDGNNPTILYAYGGFQVSETPSYSANIGKLWLEKGGVFVLANIRGGGEFGPAWHEAGLKTKRQIIYDDFASVARDLIAKKITIPRRLGIMGGSNGGLLMGVEFTQHPELWHAVDIQVPLLDMLRFEKIAAGTSWAGEYGSVSVPAERAFLAHISPYNNIRKGAKYPEPLIWTTTKDDRVGPQHARKFAARLSEYGIPYLYYEVTEGGHGSGANLKEKAHTTALEMTYFARKLMD
ncbi:MAG TPA: prolyl oligopeptidase family serine peptidase [Rhizomicrobium sp.]|jgi:prolyl oligopeptidase|nr:prolyl oligopeptidase family serine peptidase [Rhizomicrobium sp.]